MSDELYNNEVAFELQPKVIDESRQGEALTVERPQSVKANGKSPRTGEGYLNGAPMAKSCSTSLWTAG